MLNISDYHISVPVRCFQTDGFRCRKFGPFNPTFVNAICIYNYSYDTEFQKAKIVEGDAIISPYITNKSAQDIIDVINETWKQEFDSRKNVEAYIFYDSNDWEGISLVMLEFPKIEKENI